MIKKDKYYECANCKRMVTFVPTDEKEHRDEFI